jgi:plasmid stabilization system protein ParE
VNLRVLDEAAAELADAIARYESIESGLGVRLKEEVRSATDWISGHPELPRVRSNGHRRVNLRIFPYYIAFLIHAEEIWVLAVAHSARLPEYWITRSLP